MNTRLSEGEGASRKRVLNRCAAARRITCCEEDRLPSLLGGTVFQVQNGTIRV